MEKRVEGKVAFVTGGGSGIGKAAALLLARHGAKVCLLDRTPEQANEVKAEIEAFGGEACVFETDISQPEMIEKGIKHVVDLWGKLDIVFANAGVNGKIAPIEEMTLEDWDTTIDINLRGTFLTVKYAIPYMKEKGGSIIITSSINGNRVFSNFGFSIYSTSKAGQVAFMKMAALELAKFNIRVNAVCPGAIETSIDDNTDYTPELARIKIPVEFPEGDQPLRRGPGHPDHVADLVLFLASDESAHITGTPIYIDGAESLLHG
ncbi:SDR family oxidoreductase [Gorillibacterium sp. sgz500922]|uniref:SDR family oxidoreductase n=1 Tax=Gorillibacterium sp. sgz500922 TaxID=3446694 RepID=UPI003F6718DE